MKAEEGIEKKMKLQLKAEKCKSVFCFSYSNMTPLVGNDFYLVLLTLMLEHALQC